MSTRIDADAESASANGSASVGLSEREFRAAAEYLASAEVAPDHYRVYNDRGDEYAVDRRLGACTCPDARYREAHCKHLRRVEMTTGDRDLPPIPDDAVDPLLRANRQRREDSDA